MNSKEGKLKGIHIQTHHGKMLKDKEKNLKAAREK